jgi:hypothetical protein
MIFSPPHLGMWDTWCFYHAGTWYLYFLSSSELQGFDGVSLAMSQDGVYWQLKGTPLRKPASYEGGAMFTACLRMPTGG